MSVAGHMVSSVLPSVVPQKGASVFVTVRVAQNHL